MSFILNALRKCEQERQTLQSESVTDKILVPPLSQGRSNTTKFFVCLILANVLIIVCFIWLLRNSLISPTVSAAPTVPQPVEPKIAAKPIVQAKPRPETESVSIAELIEYQKQNNSQPVKLTNEKKAVNGDIDSTSITPAQTTPVVADSNAIPYLNDLPADFRQNLPKFSVNVFVYSQIPEQRFVMIDMVKYKPGQQIKNAMLLKEILPDSFVVDYQNRTFKIKRP